MDAFIRLDGIAAPLPIDNVDTDALIPSRETQSVARTGYGEKLFANWRYEVGTREPRPEFILNQPPFDAAQILVAGRNFGCGSSREAAVWALSQFGIRCVVAESFGTIFRNNCIRNGLLPIILPIETVERILDQLSIMSVAPRLVVDLEACTIQSPDGQAHGFSIDALEREMLLTGVDEIAVTLKRRDGIDAFRAQDRIDRPWVYQDARQPKSAQETHEP